MIVQGSMEVKHHVLVMSLYKRLERVSDVRADTSNLNLSVLLGLVPEWRGMGGRTFGRRVPHLSAVPTLLGLY